MSYVSFILFLMLNGMFLTRFDVAVANEQCKSNSDCTSGNVCCAGKYHSENRTCNSDSCFGRYCSTDGDCGGKGECCISNKCVTYNCTECHNNTDCAASEYCCKQKNHTDINVCRRSCIGESCSINEDCGATWEKCNWQNKCEESTNDECESNPNCTGSIRNVCCKGKNYRDGRKCQSDSCIGRYCSTDGDCGGKGECCISNKCVTYNCTECHRKSDCSPSEYCCKQRRGDDINVCRRSCVGETCFVDSDCGGPGETCTGWGGECEVSANDECKSNSDCTSSTRNVCCKGKTYRDGRKCQPDSCIGRYCSTDGDCGGKGECCIFNECVTANCTECHRWHDCADSEYCCKQKNHTDINVCRRSCIGEPCSSDSDCGDHLEKCRENECARVNAEELDSSSTSYKARSLSLTGYAIGFFFACFIPICVLINCIMYWRKRRTRRPLQQTQSTTNIISYKKTSSCATLHPPPGHFNQGQDVAQPRQNTLPAHTSLPPKPPAYPW